MGGAQDATQVRKARDNKMGMQPNKPHRFRILPKSKSSKSGDLEIRLLSLAGAGFETGATEQALKLLSIHLLWDTCWFLLVRAIFADMPLLSITKAESFLHCFLLLFCGEYIDVHCIWIPSWDISLLSWLFFFLLLTIVFFP